MVHWDFEILSALLFCPVSNEKTISSLSIELIGNSKIRRET